MFKVFMKLFRLYIAFDQSGLTGGGAVNEPPITNSNNVESAPVLPEWLQTYPDDLKGSPSLHKFKEPVELAKSYINLQKLVGMDKLPLPAKDAPPEIWNEIYNRLGRPESPDKYELAEGVNRNDPLLKEFLQVAHENGSLPHQVAKFVDWYNKAAANVQSNQQEQSQQEQTQQIEQNYASLQKEWGKDYEKNRNVALRAFAAFADDETIQYMQESGLEHDPKLWKMFANIGSKMSEASLGKDSGRGANTMSRENIDAEILKIHQDKSHPYWIANAPGHKEAVERMNELNKLKLAS